MVNSRSVLLLVCTVLVVGAICGSDARQDGKRRPCCVAVTNLDMSAEVVGETYRQQAATPPCVKAIIFNTEHGPLCADPNAQWVKDLIASMTRVLVVVILEGYHRAALQSPKAIREMTWWGKSIVSRLQHHPV
ncbi:unnamed protein product [Oreochromis niloticus]|nr:unnamed protein product [Mustela putorius furo]